MASERELSIAFFVTAESSFLGALWKIERLEEQMMAKNQAEQAASDKKKKKEQFKGHFLSLLHITTLLKWNNKIIRPLIFYCSLSAKYVTIYSKYLGKYLGTRKNSHKIGGKFKSKKCCQLY